MLSLSLPFPAGDLLAAGALGQNGKVHVKRPSVPHWSVLFALETSLKTDTPIVRKNRVRSSCRREQTLF